MTIDGFTAVASSHGPKDTMNRFEAAVKAKGMTVFARIDHAAGAAANGLSLRPTEVLIFGNAKAGTATATTSTIMLPMQPPSSSTLTSAMPSILAILPGAAK